MFRTVQLKKAWLNTVSYVSNRPSSGEGMSIFLPCRLLSCLCFAELNVQTELVNIYIYLSNTVWRIFKPSKKLKQWNNEIYDPAYIYLANIKGLSPMISS